jgi:hypothetical protein
VAAGGVIAGKSRGSPLPRVHPYFHPYYEVEIDDTGRQYRGGTLHLTRTFSTGRDRRNSSSLTLNPQVLGSNPRGRTQSLADQRLNVPHQARSMGLYSHLCSHEGYAMPVSEPHRVRLTAAAGSVLCSAIRWTYTSLVIRSDYERLGPGAPVRM